ncbi:hypothetical protein ACFQY4_12660 [Catellatospora bangladeshensis]|uniref:Uncharacterized protein n=1 Tax=Catellatospora bangladeshensis TaxID=310355 RepID=A0A8J3NNY5_9ACTN|nr:hypothetical protein [Catellatospora bangladeshensis]GIF85310.1 hypothetical protein Cba03nite_66590 [Catellatospora bangladeshensis]
MQYWWARVPFGLVLTFGMPAVIAFLWLKVPDVWHGRSRWTSPDHAGNEGRLYRIHPRSYVTGILPLTALAGALTALGMTLAQEWWLRVGLFRVTILLAALAVPLTVLQWVVNAFNRPAMLVPPVYRHLPGWVGQRWPRLRTKGMAPPETAATRRAARRARRRAAAGRA